MRMGEGRETFNRLLNWDRGQAPSERLAATILSKEGFHAVDPSHPLGGRDGLKDMTLSFEGKRWIGAVYFPRGQKSFSDIQNKFSHDLEGVKTNNAKGLVFVTNQEISLGERKTLAQLMPEVDVQIYHLERIGSLLNTPAFYGIRMEFLEIEMTKEEQVAFFADQEQSYSRIANTLEKMVEDLDEYKALVKVTSARLPTSSIDEDECEFDGPRSVEEIEKMEGEFLDKIWLDRHLMLNYNIENGYDTVDPQIWEGALKSAKRVIEKYGEENLGPYSDFEWGMLNGKLSALRWVLGDDWDMLDT